VTAATGALANYNDLVSAGGTFAFTGAADAALTVTQALAADAEFLSATAAGTGTITLTGATAVGFTKANVTDKLLSSTGGIIVQGAAGQNLAVTKSDVTEATLVDIDGLASVTAGAAGNIAFTEATSATLLADLAKLTVSGGGVVTVSGAAATNESFSISKTVLDGLGSLTANGTGDIAVTGAIGASFTADLEKLTATGDDVTFTGASNQSFTVTTVQLAKMTAGGAATGLTATGTGNITLQTTSATDGALDTELGQLAAGGAINVTFSSAGNVDYSTTNVATVLDASGVAGHAAFGITTTTGAQTIKAATADGTYTGGAGADSYILTGSAAATVVIGDTDSGITVLTADTITGFNVGSILKMGTVASATSNPATDNYVEAAGAVADFAAAFAAANTALGTLGSANTGDVEAYAFEWDATNGYLFNDTDGNGVADQVVVLVGITGTGIDAAQIIA